MRLSCVMLLCVACLSGGCFQPSNSLLVKPLNDAEFRMMTQVIRPQLVQKGILDAEGAWYSPRVSFGRFGSRDVDNAGEILLQRLSPAFRFPGMDPAQLPATFRGLLTDEARVAVSDHSFTVNQGMDRIFVAVVAVTDWNRDGTQDWLVLCRIEPLSTPGAQRDYYLVLTDLNQPVLMAQVLAVRDCLNKRCQVFTSPSDSGLIEDTPAIELMQGQESVTHPPVPRAAGQTLPLPAAAGSTAGPAAGKDDSGLSEKRLTQ